jgi:hypothetical protein
MPPRARGYETEEVLMRRPSLLPAMFVIAVLFLASCASPSASTEESPGGEPTEQATESEGPAETPAATEEAEESQGDEGGSSGDAPALADGPWTGGQGAVTVSGGVEWSTDEPITTDVSETTDAKTLLAYNSDDTYVTIFINLTGVPFHASVTAPDWDASSEDCDVTYERADDTGIEATFSCVVDEFHSFTGENPTDPIMIEGTFTATR